MNTRDNPVDSTLIKFIREGENIVARVRQGVAMRRVLGIGFLVLASLLFIPPWFLIPGLVFGGLSLLDFKPFRFGSCGRPRRSSSKGLSSKESETS